MMNPSDIPGYNPRVRERIEAKRKCTRPEQHAKLQPPQEWGDLCVAESLNPDAYIRYTTCGLCAGLLEILN
jgi:hypothetical protein